MEKKASENRGQHRHPEPIQSVFRRQVEALMDRLYGTALRLTRNPDEAEDVVAEAVSNAWCRLEQLDDPNHLEGWLFRILHNTFIDHWRRKQCRQEKEVSLDEPETSDTASFSLFAHLHQPFLLWIGQPEADFINQLLEQDLTQAIDALADPYRIVLVLVEIQGHSYDEVAHILDVPSGTVRSRLNRARGLLQKSLWRQGQEAGLTGHATSKSGRVSS
jgi:RNA polymerase sigma-70 factor (ECF subfamily)